MIKAIFFCCTFDANLFPQLPAEIAMHLRWFCAICQVSILAAWQIAEAVLDAEVRIGELMREVPKASGGDRRSDNFKKDNGVQFETKADIIEKAGFTVKQVQQQCFQPFHLLQFPHFGGFAKPYTLNNGVISAKADVIEQAGYTHFVTPLLRSYQPGLSPFLLPAKIAEIELRAADGPKSKEQQIGELIREVPKAKNQYDAMDSGVQSKKDVIENAGLTHFVTAGTLPFLWLREIREISHKQEERRTCMSPPLFFITCKLGILGP